MLNHLHIDNFKCFVRLRVQAAEASLAARGQRLGARRPCSMFWKRYGTFSSTEPSRRQRSPQARLLRGTHGMIRHLRYGVTGNGGNYLYRLVLDHDRKGMCCRIKEEKLTFNQKPLYHFDGSDAPLYRDDFSAGPTFPFDWSRSAIPTIPERDDNQKLTWFRNRVEKIYALAPDPLRMVARSEGELEQPDRRLHQLVSWLRHLSQESVDTVSRPTGLSPR